MPTLYQHLRSLVAGKRPAKSSAPEGTVYVAIPDRQIGTMDSAGNPVDLVAVRNWNANSSYKTNELVKPTTGEIYRAKAAVGPKPWSSADWELITNPTATLDGRYIVRAGGSATQPITVPDATASTHAANLGQVQAMTAGGIPAGVIVMWSGTIATIPAGWALCDGTGGTPDLTDKFIVGANTGTEGNTGGANSRTLTTANLPTHSHSISSFSVSSGNNNVGHTHSGSTGNQSVTHTHSGTTGTVSAWHTHNGTTGFQNANHNHGASFQTVTGPDLQSGSNRNWYGYGNTGNQSHSHSHGFYTGNPSANHTHAITTGGNSANHTHNITTGFNSANHTHSLTIPVKTTTSIGSGTSFDNRPTFYALAFIQKL